MIRDVENLGALNAQSTGKGEDMADVKKETRNSKNKNEIRSAEENGEDSNGVEKTVTACANRCFDCISATKRSSLTFSTI